MKEQGGRFLRLAAGALAGGVIICTVLFVWGGFRDKPAGGLNVVVMQENRVVYEAVLQDENGSPLHPDGQLVFEGGLGEYIVEFMDGKVRMYLSNCPDKICMNKGWTENPARPIICLPQRIVLYTEYAGGGAKSGENAGNAEGTNTLNIDALVE